MFIRSSPFQTVNSFKHKARICFQMFIGSSSLQVFDLLGEQMSKNGNFPSVFPPGSPSKILQGNTCHLDFNWKLKIKVWNIYGHIVKCNNTPCWCLVCLTAGMYGGLGWQRGETGGQFFVSDQSLPQDGSDAQLSVDHIFWNPRSNRKTRNKQTRIILVLKILQIFITLGQMWYFAK